MSRVRDLLPGLAKRNGQPTLRTFPGTNAVDLGPIAPAPAAVLQPPAKQVNINTGKQSYQEQAVVDRLETRAWKAQQPLRDETDRVLQSIMAERMDEVFSQFEHETEVYVGLLRFMVPAGRSRQPRSIKIAFEEKRNLLMRHQSIMQYGREGRKAGRPEVEDFQDEIKYRAHQDISVR